VDVISKVPIPIDVSRLKAFLGLVAKYYRQFGKRFNQIAKPVI
jgi:hypothetical protein